ncbi:MAG: hypothetical protein ACKO47_03330, partial [Alphaproteobacteria bacterium]
MKILQKKIDQSLIKKFSYTSALAGAINLASLSNALASYSTVTATVSSNTLTEVMCNILRISTG